MTGKKIAIVVDDTPSIRISYQRILAKGGFESNIFYDLNGGLGFIKSTQKEVGVVLLDRNGVCDINPTQLDEMIAHCQSLEIPIYSISSHRDGFDGYPYVIQKPHLDFLFQNPAQILAALKPYLE